LQDKSRFSFYGAFNVIIKSLFFVENIFKTTFTMNIVHNTLYINFSSYFAQLFDRIYYIRERNYKIKDKKIKVQLKVKII